jgi:predicted metalloprotease
MAIGGGSALLLLIFALITGQNPLDMLGSLAGGGGESAGIQPDAASVPTGAPADELGQFAATILGSTEDVWTEIFAAEGQRYQTPTLVLFSDAVDSACGMASSAVGPFYCPRDGKVYLDLAFFQMLSDRFEAPGDFAAAYVIAHEVGHHVQNLLGIADRVTAAQQRAGQEEANALSVRMELQADCLAGVWGYHANRTRKLLEPGDAEEGLRAAARVGAVMMQKRRGGYVQPEAGTHGSSEMRVEWLRRGLSTGDSDGCDTFANRL